MSRYVIDKDWTVTDRLVACGLIATHMEEIARNSDDLLSYETINLWSNLIHQMTTGRLDNSHGELVIPDVSHEIYSRQYTFLDIWKLFNVKIWQAANSKWCKLVCWKLKWQN